MIATKLNEPRLNRIRFCDRQAANNTASDAALEPRLHGRLVANTSANLHGHVGSRGDACNDVPILLRAGPCTIQVNNMEVSRRERRKLFRNSNGVVAVFG